MEELTRQEAIERIKELIEQVDEDSLEDILNDIFEKMYIDNWVKLTDKPRPTFEMQKEELLEEARSLIDIPNRPDYLTTRFDDIYKKLEDFAEQELPEEASYLEIQALVDSWISGV